MQVQHFRADRFSCPGHRVRGPAPRPRCFDAIDGRREAPRANRARSVRQDAGSCLQVLSSSPRRRPTASHRRPDRDDLAELADGEGNRPSALDPLAHGDSSRHRHTIRPRSSSSAGGANDGKPPARPNPLLVDIAVTTKSVVAELRMVPNQPVTFAGETRTRKEDELIAYSWDKFLRTGDEQMAGAPADDEVGGAGDGYHHDALRTAASGCGAAGGLKIDKFVVSGASKRGWTAWATAASTRASSRWRRW